MMRHIFWIPLCALLLALSMPVNAQQPKKLVVSLDSVYDRTTH